MTVNQNLSFFKIPLLLANVSINMNFDTDLYELVNPTNNFAITNTINLTYSISFHRLKVVSFTFKNQKSENILTSDVLLIGSQVILNSSIVIFTNNQNINSFTYKLRYGTYNISLSVKSLDYENISASNQNLIVDENMNAFDIKINSKFGMYKIKFMNDSNQQYFSIFENNTFIRFISNVNSSYTVKYTVNDPLINEIELKLYYTNYTIKCRFNNGIHKFVNRIITVDNSTNTDVIIQISNKNILYYDNLPLVNNSNTFLENLSSQNINCDDNYAISKISFQEESARLKIRYECIEIPTSISFNLLYLETGENEQRRVIYLDRYYLNCSKGFLKRIQLIITNTTYTHDVLLHKVKFQYECYQYNLNENNKQTIEKPNNDFLTSLTGMEIYDSNKYITFIRLSRNVNAGIGLDNIYFSYRVSTFNSGEDVN